MAESEYVTAGEAQELLGISKPRMAQILGPEPNSDKSILKWEPSPLDGRVKLVRRADVEALAAKARPRKKDAA